MLEACYTLIDPSQILRKLINFIEMTFHGFQLPFESFFTMPIYIRQRGLVRPGLLLLGNGVIALRDSLAPAPWHVRVNFDVEEQYCTSVLIHPRQREELRVLKR